jgi:hypothetical protein
MRLKLFFIGLGLILAGLLIAFVEFVYPELFFGWFGLGLAGPLVWGLFIVLILIGIGALRGSYAAEELPPLAPQTRTIVDDQIDIEGEQYVKEEFAQCRKHLDPHENIVALITGTVEGTPNLNRLAITNTRLLYYPKTTVQTAISLEDSDVNQIKGKRNPVLTHLGEITVISKGKRIRFKNVGIEYVHQITDLISSRLPQPTTRT